MEPSPLIKRCCYCGNVTTDLVQVQLYLNGEYCWVWSCPEKTNPMQFLPDCAGKAQMSAEG